MKLLLKLVVALVLLLVLLMVGVGFLIDPAAVQAVSAGVSAATGCDSSLGSADIGLLSGDVKFEQLEIQNPPGFREGPLLSLGNFNANWDTASLFSDEVQVNRLELDGLVLALELKGSETNLDPLLQRLRELSAASGGDAPSSSGEEPDAQEPASEQGAGKKINIESVRIAGVRTELYVSGVPGIEGQYAVDIPEFVIEDLGNGEQSGTLTEWSARILEVLLAEAEKAGAGEFPAQWQSLLSGDLDELQAAALEQLEGEAQEWLGENQDQLPDEVQKGLDALQKEVGGLGDLFKKD